MKNLVLVVLLTLLVTPSISIGEENYDESILENAERAMVLNVFTYRGQKMFFNPHLDDWSPAMRSFLEKEVILDRIEDDPSVVFGDNNGLIKIEHYSHDFGAWVRTVKFFNGSEALNLSKIPLLEEGRLGGGPRAYSRVDEDVVREDIITVKILHIKSTFDWLVAQKVFQIPRKLRLEFLNKGKRLFIVEEKNYSGKKPCLYGDTVVYGRCFIAKKSNKSSGSIRIKTVKDKIVFSYFAAKKEIKKENWQTDFMTYNFYEPDEDVWWESTIAYIF